MWLPIVGLTALLALAGCAASTGIVPVGPGVYRLSVLRAPAVGGGPEALRVVFAETDSFCQAQNRAFAPIAITPAGDPFTPFYPTAYDATFRCLPPNDPAVTRFRLEHSVD